MSDVFGGAFKAELRELLREVLREMIRTPAAASDAPEYLSYAEAGHIAHVSPETIGSWVKRRWLNRYGARPPLVKASELREHLDNPRPRGGALTVDQRAAAMMGDGRG